MNPHFDIFFNIVVIEHYRVATFVGIGRSDSFPFIKTMTPKEKRHHEHTERVHIGRGVDRF
jgi:hypothetical protein